MKNNVKMNTLINFGWTALYIFLQLSSIESRQKYVYVALTDDQCTEWKEVAIQDYQKKLQVPIKRVNGTSEEEAEEAEKCDLIKPKEETKTCTCMENLGLDPNGIETGKNDHKTSVYKSTNENDKSKKGQYSKSKRGRSGHSPHKNDTGSFSEEFDASDEESVNGTKKHRNESDKTGKDKSKGSKRGKGKNGKRNHKNDNNSFSEEFDGSEEDQMTHKDKKHLNAADEKENNAEEVKSEEDDYEDINETTNKDAKSASYSYADSQEEHQKTIISNAVNGKPVQAVCSKSRPNDHKECLSQCTLISRKNGQCSGDECQCQDSDQTWFTLTHSKNSPRGILSPK